MCFDDLAISSPGTIKSVFLMVFYFLAQMVIVISFFIARVIFRTVTVIIKINALPHFSQ